MIKPFSLLRRCLALNEFVKQVAEFQRTFDPENITGNRFHLEELPVDKGQALIRLRYNLLAEEGTELKAALQDLFDLYEKARSRHESLFRFLNKSADDNINHWHKAKKEVADALGDILVVTIGTALAFGLDIEEIMRRIHESNMSKLGEDGQPIYRKDGKVMKGPHYFPPDLDGLV